MLFETLPAPPRQRPAIEKFDLRKKKGASEDAP